MNLAEIESLLASGESETLEFKQSTAQLSRAAETLCAFLNANGGRVILGITPGGKIVGQQVADKTQQELANTLRKFEPPAPIEIVRAPLPNTQRELLVLEATPSGEALPFVYTGRPYQRIGTTTSLMPQERYQQLLLTRLHNRHRWENTPALGVTLDHLDHEEILRTVRTGVAVGRLPESTGADPGDILERLGLRVNDHLLNAAVVLFGTRLLPDFPQCQLRMARFRGTDKTEFLDNRQVAGHGFLLLDEAMLFLQRHLPVAGRIHPGLFERIDEPLFPLAALREALVNAFCHRDYAYAGGAVSLAIYDDRLEVWSDGGLPLGVQVEDLKRDHRSRPRNPLIADVFFRRGLVERWGRRTQRIVELCVQAGHPEPEFIDQADAVGVWFWPSGSLASSRVAHDFNARQRELLEILGRKETLPLREIREQMANPPSDRTLQAELASLRRLGLINARGRGRGAVYWLRRERHE